jgi:hypothetical protein
MTDEEFKKLEKKVTDLMSVVDQLLLTMVPVLNDVAARVAVLEEKLDKLSPPSGVARLL